MQKKTKKKSSDQKFTFSGHESFQCRQLWLKKGYDFINKKGSFQDEDAVIDLGVGKNMVSSIRFWMKAFNIIDQEDKITTFGRKLLDDDGWDPYLENDASLWLLHFQLIKTNIATTYNLIFNDLRRERIEFTKENFISFVKRKVELNGGSQFTENTFRDDFNVFTKMYMRTDVQSKDREDAFSGVLADLNIVSSRGQYYVIENSSRDEIPNEIILACMLDLDKPSTSIDLTSLENNKNSIGSIFAINRIGLADKAELIAKKSKGSIVYNEHAGIRELQFKTKLNYLTILDKYYAS